MICWPFGGDQPLICKCVCGEWKVGIEIKSEEEEQVKKRNEVEKFVRELMDGGEKCKELRKNAAEWRRLGEEAAAAPNGSSYKNFEKLVNEVLTRKQS